MTNIEDAKIAILHLIQDAHRMQHLGNWLNVLNFHGQRDNDAPTSEDGVYGHATQVLRYIRRTGMVSPGLGLADWDDVDCYIWDNCISNPSINNLQTLYIFDDERVAEVFAKRLGR